MVDPKVTNQPTAKSEPGPTRVADSKPATRPVSQPASIQPNKFAADVSARGRGTDGDPQKVPFDLDPEVKKQLDLSGSYKPTKEKIEEQNKQIREEEQVFRKNAPNL